MTTGNRPADGGYLIIEKDDYEDFIKHEPLSVKYIKRLIGAKEYINDQKRYCLWLVGASPAELRKMPLVMERIESCKQDRLNGAEDRKKLAETPTLFRELKIPNTYIIVPRYSSENRRYIPIGFLDKDYIPADSATIIPEATLFHFGILTSNLTRTTRLLYDRKTHGRHYARPQKQYFTYEHCKHQKRQPHLLPAAR